MAKTNYLPSFKFTTTSAETMTVTAFTAVSVNGDEEAINTALIVKSVSGSKTSFYYDAQTVLDISLIDGCYCNT